MDSLGLIGVLCGVVVISWDSAFHGIENVNENAISINEFGHVVTPESSYDQSKDDSTEDSMDITGNPSDADSTQEQNLIELEGDDQQGTSDLVNISIASNTRVVSSRERSLTYEQDQLLQQFSL
ncbi:unnamed protein product [Candida parapsilosis]